MFIPIPSYASHPRKYNGVFRQRQQNIYRHEGILLQILNLLSISINAMYVMKTMIYFHTGYAHI